MSTTVSLIYNSIIGGKFYNVGEPIAEEIVPANLRQFIAKPKSKSSASEESVRHLSFDLNTPYSVDSEGFLRDSSAKQAGQMEALVTEEERIADELAEAEVSPTMAAAIEEAREDYRGDLEGAKLQAKVKAERAEAAADILREEQDAAVEDGQYDQWNAEALREAPASPQPAPPRGSVKSKPTTKPKSYVRRAGKFVPAVSVELVAGGNLYRLRKRKFGQSEKFIRYGTVKERKANVQTS
jgi:hypothetical protein